MMELQRQLDVAVRERDEARRVHRIDTGYLRQAWEAAIAESNNLRHQLEVQVHLQTENVKASEERLRALESVAGRAIKGWDTHHRCETDYTEDEQAEIDAASLVLKRIT